MSWSKSERADDSHKGCPACCSGQEAKLPKQECQGLHEARRADHDQQGIPRQLLPRRNPRELAHDEFQIALHRRSQRSQCKLSRVAASRALAAKLGRLDARVGGVRLAWRCDARSVDEQLKQMPLWPVQTRSRAY
jgi:hypothetical protein